MDDGARTFLESIFPWKKYEAKEKKETLQKVFLCITFAINPVISNDYQLVKEAPVSKRKPSFYKPSHLVMAMFWHCDNEI